MKRTNIYITEEQHQELKELSKEDGSYVSDLIRDAINDYLKKRMKEKAKKK